MLKTDIFTPSCFTSKGEIKLRGKDIEYKTVCEDNMFYDNEGKSIASIFSYSYFRSDVNDKQSRPVLFAFNGGPSTSSMMLHVGLLGPKRLKYSGVDDESIPLPPYQSCVNNQCLLDVVDIVLIDPVGTGFGRLLDETKKDLFYGIEQDAEATLTFIQSWLSRYNRWQSPKYLMGESYGCTRASTVAGMGSLTGSNRAYSLTFDGLIMIGNTVSLNKYYRDRSPIYSAVLAFPTLAAVNWYHNHPSEQSIEDFISEAKDFADTKYLQALYKGRRLSGDNREKIIQSIMYYTGVSREYLEKRSLFLDDAEFRSQVIRSKGCAVSRLDGRFTRPLHNSGLSEEKWGLKDDAIEGKYNVFFQAVLCGELFPSLGIKFNRNFVNYHFLYDRWDNDIKGQNTSQHLSSAMRRTPTMRTFFINGWYDICTQIGVLYYTIDHSDLPMDRVIVKGYEAGHMAYLGEDNIQEVFNDLYKFIKN